MARKSRIVVVERPSKGDEEKAELEEILDEQEKEAEAEEKEERQIEAWLKDFQSRFTDQPCYIVVDKFDQGGWSICNKYPLEAFDPTLVRDEFGGGRYRTTLYGPQGAYIKGGRQEFKFATPLPSSKKDAPTPDPLASPIFSMFLKQMEESNKTLTSLMTAMITAQGAAPAKTNDLEMLVKAMQGVNSMIPKDTGLKQIQDAMQLAASMRDMLAPEKEESSGGGGLMSDIKEFFTVLPKIKEQLGQLPAGRPNPAPANAGPLPVTIQGEPPKGPPPMPSDPLSQKIISLVPTFVEAARTGQPIDQWADYLGNVLEVQIMPLLIPVVQSQYKLIEITDDLVYDGLLKKAKDPVERDTIFKQIPPLAPYRNWVNQVIDCLVKMYESEGEDIPAEANGNGHTPEVLPE